MNYCSRIFLSVALALSGTTLHADLNSATAAMEDAGNPLVRFDTGRGDIYIELLPDEAPDNVGNVLALINGEVEIEDPVNGFTFRPRYYDGLRFHRVLPGQLVQTGAPSNHPLGAPGVELADEINADSLGLNEEPVMHDDGRFNVLLGIDSRSDVEENILAPLYLDMGIAEASTLEDQQLRVLSRLRQLTVKSLYQIQGYRYRTDIDTRPITRGVVALANRGPGSNGPEFFIALQDLPTLNGKYTVIGHVVEGMDVADGIGATAVDPQRFSRLSTVIYSAQQVGGATPLARRDD